MSQKQQLLVTFRSWMNVINQSKEIIKKKPFVAALIVFVLWIIGYKIYMKLIRKFRKLPAGPDGLPFVGVLPYMLITGNDKWREYIANNYNKYITLYYVGADRSGIVTINDYKLAKQIFSNPLCQDRSPIFHSMIANEADVLRVKYGKQWKERRKIIRSILLTMEDSNYVDKNIQLFIKKYIDPKIENNMKQNSFIQSDDLSISIRHLAFSMILKTMFGVELKSDDPLFIQMATLYEKWSIDIFVAFFNSILPIIRYFTAKKQIDHVRDLENQLNELIKEKFFNPLIDKFNDDNIENKETYFEHAYSYINNDKLNKNNITLNQLLMDFTILIQASIDTASFVLQMGLLNLIKYPQIQDTVYNELYQQFPNKQFNLKKVIKCPKFRAYVNEILRVALPIPSGVPRYSISDINVEFIDDLNKKHKYVIPKGSIVTLNLSFMHYENIDKWGKNGKEINLNNWLENIDKLTFKNRNDVFPFSVGMRDCVGRSLALRLLYSIFATMILKYKFLKYDNNFEIKTKFSLAGAHRDDTHCKIILQKRE